MKEVIAKARGNDAKKAFDIAAHNQFNATPLTVAPTAGTATDVVTLTTNGTVTITNNVALGNGHVKAIIDLMKERNIPPYMADDYVSIAHPSKMRKLKNGPERVRDAVFNPIGGSSMYAALRLDRQPQPDRLEYSQQGLEGRIALRRQGAIQRFAAYAGLCRHQAQATVCFRHRTQGKQAGSAVARIIERLHRDLQIFHCQLLVGTKFSDLPVVVRGDAFRFLQGCLRFHSAHNSFARLMSDACERLSPPHRRMTITFPWRPK